MIRCAKDDSGFTLMEFLVTLTLLGLLSVAMLGGIRFGTRVWQTTDTATSADNRARLAEAEISNLISHAYPAFITTATSGYVDFQGDEHGVEFLAPDASLPGSLSRVSLGATPQPNGLALAVERRVELAPDQTAVTHIYARNINAVEFAYYGAVSRTAAARWYASWKNMPSLPRLIRIRVALADPHARPWPELTVAPRIDADVGCMYDTLTRYCQGRR